MWLLDSARLFFFQAEDGIRDRNVTGVQTCALPICTAPWAAWTYCTRQQVQAAHGAVLKNLREGTTGLSQEQIGRASCRERVKIAVVAGAIKKKNKAKAY